MFLNVDLDSRSLVSQINQHSYNQNGLPCSPTERIAGLIAATTTAADALTRHQGQANKVRIKATRTTLLTLRPPFSLNICCFVSPRIKGSISGTEHLAVRTFGAPLGGPLIGHLMVNTLWTHSVILVT